MSKNIIYQITITGLILSLFTGCKEETQPDRVTLLAPSDNSACLKGTSESDTTAMLNFTWNNVINASSYQLDIKNLLTQKVATFTTNETTYTADLEINMPYSWSVTSVNSNGKTLSATWQLYLSGVATSSYAPFPAELITPDAGEIINANGLDSVKVTFQWKGSDSDNDISTYTLNLDNNNATKQAASLLTTTSYTSILQRSKTYYWRIITMDKAGNSSSSMVGAFFIK